MENQKKSFFRRVWSRFQKLGKGTSNEQAQQQQDATKEKLDSEEAPQENPMFEELGTDTAKHFSDPSNFNFDVWIYLHGKSLWEQGQRDGRKGMDPRSFSNYGKVHARGLVEQVRRLLNGNKATIEVEKRLADATADFEKMKYERIQDAIHMRHRFPGKHSFSRGIIYLISAFFLVLADFPLSILVVKQGFEMGKTTDLFGFIKADYLSLILAVGIALIATMVKIVYEDFFGGRLSHYATIFSDHKDIDQNNKKDRNKMRWGYFGKKFFLLVALTLSIVTICKLGAFRFETMKTDKVAILENEKENKIIKLKKGYEQLDTNSKKAIDNKIDGIRQRYDEKEQKIDLGKDAFILLTLCFPVIGGICLSLGLHNLSNRREFENNLEKEEKAKADWVAANQIVCTLEGHLARLDSSIQYVEDLKFEERLFAYLLATYEHGYTDGYYYPDEIVGKATYFDKALRMRNKLVSRQVLERTYQGFPEKEFNDLKNTPL